MRERPDPVLSNETAAAHVQEALNQVISHNPGASLADNIRQMLESAPDSKRVLAQQMAINRGITYKSARDTLTRYAKGARKPSRQHAPEITSAIRRQRVQKALAGNRVGVVMEATMQYSKTKWKGKIKVNLSGARKDEFARAVEKNDTDTAIRVVMDKYDPDYAEAATITEVQSLTIEPR